MKNNELKKAEYLAKLNAVLIFFNTYTGFMREYGAVNESIRKSYYHIIWGMITALRYVSHTITETQAHYLEDCLEKSVYANEDKFMNM